jgi:hypothetical protein
VASALAGTGQGFTGAKVLRTQQYRDHAREWRAARS